MTTEARKSTPGCDHNGVNEERLTPRPTFCVGDEIDLGRSKILEVTRHEPPLLLLGVFDKAI